MHKITTNRLKNNIFFVRAGKEVSMKNNCPRSCPRSYTLHDLRRDRASYICEMAEADARRLAPRSNIPTHREKALEQLRSQAREEETRHWRTAMLPLIRSGGLRCVRWCEGETGDVRSR